MNARTWLMAALLVAICGIILRSFYPDMPVVGVWAAGMIFTWLG